MRAAIVTPTYNEALNLEQFVRSVRLALPDAQIVVVDDSSPDGTGAIADRLASSDPLIYVMHRPVKSGLGTAYIDGFTWALNQGFDVFFEMDADLSHDPVTLPIMLEILKTADVVIGSRNIKGGGVNGWGPGRHLLSKGGSLYSRTILGLPIRDLTSGYKGYTRKALLAIDLPSIRSNGYSFQIETTYRAAQKGLRVVETPIWFTDRRAGQSKLSNLVFAEAVWMVLKLRFSSKRLT